MASERVDIPIVIDGREIRTGDTTRWSCRTRTSTCSPTGTAASRARRLRRSTPRERARAEWGNWPFAERAGVFLRAAELLSTRWRATLNAATMLGQSKTAFQAESMRRASSPTSGASTSHFARDALRRSADQRQRHLEPDRLSPARGIHLRGDAVQLHGDRRQSPHGARAHGEHRALEAGARRRC